VVPSRGDPNSSGTTDITDGVAIFSFLFLGGTARPAANPPTLTTTARSTSPTESAS
jgi:hypothetical protein